MLKKIIHYLILLPLFVAADEDPQREIEILTQSLMVEPNNIDLMFSLADLQTTLKNYNAAIPWYMTISKNAQSADVIGYANIRIGECYEEMGKLDLALQWYFQAHRSDPSEAGSLYRIAKIFRSQGLNALAYSHAKQGEALYRSQKVYRNNLKNRLVKDYQFDEELSIVSYYINRKQEGYTAADNITLRKDVPWSIKHQAIKNLHFYLENLSNFHVKTIDFPLPLIRPDYTELYHPMNPSILRTEFGYQVICRTVNYTQVGAKFSDTIDADKIFRSRNFLLSYDQNFTKLSHAEIVESLPRPRYRNWKYEGFDDCRAFQYNQQVWFTCNTHDTTDSGYPQISLCKLYCDCSKSVEMPRRRPDFEPGIDGAVAAQLKKLGDTGGLKSGGCPTLADSHFLSGSSISSDVESQIPTTRLIPLEGPDRNRCEKNWLPFVVDNQILIIYGYDPFTIYHVDSDTGLMQTFVSYEPEYDFSRFRGSAAPVEFDEGYLMLVHEVAWVENDFRLYTHRFLFLDKSFHVVKVSNPFTFLHQGVEYCCGMVIDHSGENLVMAIGVEDREAYLGVSDLNTIRSLLKPLP